MSLDQLLCIHGRESVLTGKSMQLRMAKMALDLLTVMQDFLFCIRQKKSIQANISVLQRLETTVILSRVL